jgi:predicted RNA-binding Zn-ribbon protein involved in translation (DUF1610 family)
MTEQMLWLDGNALAGMLQEAFGSDVTAEPRRCQSCGEVHMIGEHRMYFGAGRVLRCPHCGDVALRVGMLPDRYMFVFAGTWRLEVPRASI